MSANNSANSSRRGSEGTCSTISSDDVDVDLLSDETLDAATHVALGELDDALAPRGAGGLASWWR